LNPGSEAMPAKRPGVFMKQKADTPADTTPPNTVQVRPMGKIIQKHCLPVRTRIWQTTVTFEDGKSWTSDWHFTELHAKK